MMKKFDFIFTFLVQIKMSCGSWFVCSNDVFLRSNGQARNLILSAHLVYFLYIKFCEFFVTYLFNSQIFKKKNHIHSIHCEVLEI